MHRIDADGHVGNAFSDGDEGLGILGTKVDAAWLNAVQAEICNLLEHLGITLVKGTNDQVQDSVGAMVAKVWGNIQLGSTGPTLKKGYGIGTCAFEDAGLTLRIPFTTAFADAEYAAIPTFSPGGPYTPYVYDKQVGSIALRVTDGDASPTPWVNVDLSAIAGTTRIAIAIFNP